MKADLSSRRAIRIVSQCATAEEFIAVFHPYLERDALFIATGSPEEPGARVHFVMTLASGQTVLRGAAQVLEAHRDRGNFYGLRGMKLRFEELDGASQRTLSALEKGPRRPKRASSSPSGPGGPGGAVECLIYDEPGVEADEPAAGGEQSDNHTIPTLSLAQLTDDDVTAVAPRPRNEQTLRETQPTARSARATGAPGGFVVPRPQSEPGVVVGGDIGGGGGGEPGNHGPSPGGGGRSPGPAAHAHAHGGPGPAEHAAIPAHAGARGGGAPASPGPARPIAQTEPPPTVQLSLGARPAAPPNHAPEPAPQVALGTMGGGASPGTPPPGTPPPGSLAPVSPRPPRLPSPPPDRIAADRDGRARPGSSAPPLAESERGPVSLGPLPVITPTEIVQPLARPRPPEERAGSQHSRLSALPGERTRIVRPAGSHLRTAAVSATLGALLGLAAGYMLWGMADSPPASHIAPAAVTGGAAAPGQTSGSAAADPGDDPGQNSSSGQDPSSAQTPDAPPPAAGAHSTAHPPASQDTPRAGGAAPGSSADSEGDSASALVESAPAAGDAPRRMLHVRSLPSGAAVAIDGKSAGETPLDTPIRSDQEVTVELHRTGYQSWKRTLAAGSDEAHVSARLRRAHHHHR